MAEQDKTYVPGYWRASKNTKSKKEKSKRPEKIKTVTVTKEGPLTKQQFGKITLNTIKLARNLSSLPTINNEIKNLRKSLQKFSEITSKDIAGKKEKRLENLKMLLHSFRGKNFKNRDQNSALYRLYKALEIGLYIIDKPQGKPMLYS